jgi:hypothetical protein
VTEGLIGADALDRLRRAEVKAAFDQERVMALIAAGAPAHLEGQEAANAVRDWLQKELADVMGSDPGAGAHPLEVAYYALADTDPERHVRLRPVWMWFVMNAGDALERSESEPEPTEEDREGPIPAPIRKKLARSRRLPKIVPTDPA